MSEIFVKGRYYQKCSKKQEKWLRMYLDSDEIVLAWLGVYSVISPPQEEVTKNRDESGEIDEWRYLLTTSEQALVAFFDEGETLVYELPRVAFTITSVLGRAKITSGEFQFKSEFRNDYLYKEIRQLPALEPIERIRETARLNWIQREKKEKIAQFSLWLMSVLSLDRNNPFDCLSHTYIEHILKKKKKKDTSQDMEVLKDLYGDCLMNILEIDDASRPLKEWAGLWEVPGIHQLALAHLIREISSTSKESAIALALHRQARELIVKEQKDVLSHIIIDMGLAQHLLDAEEYDAAVPVLENCLKDLPDESVSELTPSKDINLTDGTCHSMKCRILELLAQARGEPGNLDKDTVAALARLQPLVSSRMSDLVNSASHTLKRRAQKLYHVLEDSDGLKVQEKEEHYCHKPVTPLSEKLIQTKMTHPGTRKEGYVDLLQNWLGKANVPDHSALKSYAERVTPQKHPLIIESLGDAAMAFGISAVDAYVSRGERSIGVRAFEGEPPFLLIGIEHLEPESDFFLRPLEMRFVFTTETAHLKFHHTRLTSDELWDGVFHKGRQILEAVSLLAGPIGLVGNALRGIQRLTGAEQILRKAEFLTTHAVKAIDILGFARGVKDTANEKTQKRDDTISDSEEQLLAACRMMQLTADRAGLVLCGDIKAAIRAVFLSSRTYCAELAIAERYGLTRALNRRNEKGELINQELALRLASLCSFYLSDDFIDLRKALTGFESLTEPLD